MKRNYTSKLFCKHLFVVWHWIKNSVNGFVELIVQFINVIVCFHSDPFVAGRITHQDIPVFVVLMAIAFDQANWH